MGLISEKKIYTFYGRNSFSLFFFSLPLTFTLLVASISHFLTAAKKIFILLFQRNSSRLFWIFRSSSFSVITSVYTLNAVEKKTRLSWCFFGVNKRFTANACGCLKCEFSSRTFFSEPKFLVCIDSQLVVYIVFLIKGTCSNWRKSVRTSW